MFASQEEEAYANLITSAFYLTAAADSGDKIPKVCPEVIRKKKKDKKREEIFWVCSQEISPVNVSPVWQCPY